MAWKGVVTLRIAGRCICAEVFQEQARQRETLYGPPRRKESEAPFRRDLETSLVPPLVRLGRDLYGTDAIAHLARGADSAKVREAALAQLRDQSVLAEIATHDSSEPIRLEAVRKLTGQAALAQAAQGDPSSNVRLFALRKLTDTAVLSTIAANDEVAEVRRQAQLRVVSLGKGR